MDRRIGILALAGFAMGTEAYAYAGHLAALAADLGRTVAGAGQLATAFALTYALAAPPVAGLAARFPRRAVLVAGLVAIGAVNLAAAVAPSMEALLALRVLAGLAAALVGPVAAVTAAELAPPAQRGKAMAVVLGGMTLAFVLGIPMGSVVGEVAGWRATFGYAGLLALAAALAIRLVLPAMPGGARPGAAAFRAALAPPVRALLGTTLVGFAATFTVVAYIGPVVTAISGLTGSGIGAMQALIGLGSLIGIAVGARHADGERAPRLLVVSFLVSAAALGLNSVLMTAPAGALPGGAVLALLGCGMVLGAAALFARTPVVQAGLHAAAPPEARPVVLALNASMVFAGQGLGAAAGGLVIAAGGLEPLGLAAALLALAGAVIALRLLRPRRAPLNTVKELMR